MILTNARIATGDPRRPYATALAISDGVLAALATAAEILKLARPGTRIIDARGMPVALPSGATVGSRVRVVTEDDRVQILAPPEDGS